MPSGTPSESDYSSPVFRALDFVFRIQTTDPSLGAYLQGLFTQFTCAAPADHVYHLVDRGESSENGRYELHFDAELLRATKSPSVIQSLLLWHINQQVVAKSSGALLIHAAGAQHENVGLVFPARMESGKSTLVAGLVRSGLGYLTDETVAFDPDTLLIRPFPKALSIDTGSWGVLADLKPRVSTEVERFQRPQWHVTPDSIRAGAIGGECEARFIIAPRYEAGAETRLEPLSRADGLMILVENSFNVAQWGGRGLHLLGEIVRRCRCYRLTVGALDDACDAVHGLLNGAARPDSA